MLIAWTTVAQRVDAERLAAEAAQRRLAACVQVEGPVSSHYLWQGRLERGDEFRLCFKFLPAQREALTAWVMSNHPYDTPEWIVVEAVAVGEKYLSWAKASVQPLAF